MRKILIIVLAVILTLSLSLTSVIFAAGGKKEVNLAQEAGQAWLDSTVAVTGEPVQWIGARLTTPQVLYDLKGKPNAYMFAIENNDEVVGYIIVGSSEYGYPMWEAAGCPPPSIPSADEVKSTLQRDLGLDVTSVGRPMRLLYLGFDNLFAIYQAGGQEVSVNLLFDFAVAAANLRTAIPSPEVYKANNEAIELARPEQLQATGDNALPLASTYKFLPIPVQYCTWCGPSSGVNIGWYYKTRPSQYGPQYPNLPQPQGTQAQMYNELVNCWGKDHPIWGGEYWDGFKCMTLPEYNNFNCVSDPIVTAGDYWNRVADINNNWPIAIFCWNFYYLPPGEDTDVPHWMVIRGYKYPYGTIQYAICCTDSFRCTQSVYLDWNNIGLFPQTYTIKDS